MFSYRYIQVQPHSNDDWQMTSSPWENLSTESYNYSIVLKGTINGEANQIRIIEDTDISNDTFSTLPFDDGTDIVITEKFDFTDWVNSQSELGTKSYECPSYGKTLFYEYSYFPDEVKNYILEDYEYYPNLNFALTILNNVNLDGIPEGTIKKIFKPENGNAGEIKLPTIKMNITTEVTGNLADLNGKFESIELNGEYYDVDANSSQIYDCYVTDDYSSFCYSDNVYYNPSSGYYGDYIVTKSFTNGENVYNYPILVAKRDSNGKLTGEWNINVNIRAERSGSTSYTGIEYNILPFAIVIAIAGIGIIIMKKTSSKKGGARYE